MKRPKLVVLSGAGISAESGLATFRGGGGLWEGHDVMEVASIDGWMRNPTLVLRFYNERRRAAEKAVPNEAHLALAALEAKMDVVIITQNVDDLHEKAGSTQVIHLHGKLNEKRSTYNEGTVFPYTEDLELGDLAPDGGHFRPNIVWFGEAVPMMTKALDAVDDADCFAVIGTSLQVYPAAGLLYEVRAELPKFLIDPNAVATRNIQNLTVFQETAVQGVPKMIRQLELLLNID
jgi:NAD-dependent deacetylase